MIATPAQIERALRIWRDRFRPGLTEAEILAMAQAVRRLLRRYLVLVLLLVPAALEAQEPVRVVPDRVSWGTAAVAPTVAAVEAFRSDEPKRGLLRLGLAEAIGNGVTLLMKGRIESPRPCMGYGCKADGMPSGHTMNSTIGVVSGCGSSWQAGAVAAVVTGFLRWQANRHTAKQIAAGGAIGLGSDLAARLLLPCR